MSENSSFGSLDDMIKHFGVSDIETEEESVAFFDELPKEKQDDLLALAASTTRTLALMLNHREFAEVVTILATAVAMLTVDPIMEHRKHADFDVDHSVDATAKTFADNMKRRLEWLRKMG